MKWFDLAWASDSATPTLSGAGVSSADMLRSISPAAQQQAAPILNFSTQHRTSVATSVALLSLQKSVRTEET